MNDRRSVLNVWKNVKPTRRTGYVGIPQGVHEEPRHRLPGSHLPNGRFLVVLNLDETNEVCDYIRRGGDRDRFLARFRDAVSPGFDPDRDLEHIGLANQTTMLMSESLEVQELFRQAMTDRHGAEVVASRFRAFDTICSATQDRQDAVVVLLREKPVDLMIVIGGYNSSNTAIGAYLRGNGAYVPIATPTASSRPMHPPSAAGGKTRFRAPGWLPATRAFSGSSVGGFDSRHLVGLRKTLAELCGPSAPRLRRRDLPGQTPAPQGLPAVAEANVPACRSAQCEGGKPPVYRVVLELVAFRGLPQRIISRCLHLRALAATDGGCSRASRLAARSSSRPPPNAHPAPRLPRTGGNPHTAGLKSHPNRRTRQISGESCSDDCGSDTSNGAQDFRQLMETARRNQRELLKAADRLEMAGIPSQRKDEMACAFTPADAEARGGSMPSRSGIIRAESPAINHRTFTIDSQPDSHHLRGGVEKSLSRRVPFSFDSGAASARRRRLMGAHRDSCHTGGRALCSGLGRLAADRPTLPHSRRARL